MSNISEGEMLKNLLELSLKIASQCSSKTMELCKKPHDSVFNCIIGNKSYFSRPKTCESKMIDFLKRVNNSK